MLKTLRNAWKIKEIRTKLIFTFLMLVVIRFGSELPIPGVTAGVPQAGACGKAQGRACPAPTAMQILRIFVLPSDDLGL